MNNPKGSVWRKWDLHIHTPSSGSDYADGSVTNQIIIDKLKEANVSVVAITDHFTIDVDRIIELQELAGSDITIFPGIEFRSEVQDFFLQEKSFLEALAKPVSEQPTHYPPVNRQQGNNFGDD